jgi:hypothetical protein
MSFPPQPPPRRRPLRWILNVGGVLLVSGLVAGIIGGLGGRGTPTNGTPAVVSTARAAAATKPAGPKPAVPKSSAPKPEPRLGDQVRDGKFQFTVTAMDCSQARVGLSTAKGRYCVISVTVINIGDRTWLFTGSAQQVYDAAGAKYDHDSVAELYANRNVDTFLDRVNPGDTLTGKLVFDVPKKTTPIRLELHDSLWSDGVTVKLR